MSRDRYTVRVMDTTSDEPRIKHAASYESREGASQAVDVLMDFFTLEDTRIEVTVGDTLQKWLDTLEAEGTAGEAESLGELSNRLPQEGDIVDDPEAPDFKNGGTSRREVVVLSVLPDTRADEYTTDIGLGKTVADKNPGHPPDSPVVIGTYGETDKQSKYAFPASRLEY